MLEEPLLISARRKMELLAASLPVARSPVLGYNDSTDLLCQFSLHAQVPPCTRFIEEGIRELLKARRILCGSYVYGKLESFQFSKFVFNYFVLFIP